MRQYRKLQALTRQTGAEVVRMLHTQQLTQLQSRFTPSLAAAVSTEAIGEVLSQLGGVPDSVADGVVVRTAGQRSYRATWPGDGAATLLLAAFDGSD